MGKNYMAKEKEKKRKEKKIIKEMTIRKDNKKGKFSHCSN